MPLFLIQFSLSACALCWKRFGFLCSIPLWPEWCFRVFSDFLSPFIFISPILPLTFHCRGCPVFYSHFSVFPHKLIQLAAITHLFPLIDNPVFSRQVKAFASKLETQLHEAGKVKKKTDIILQIPSTIRCHIYNVELTKRLWQYKISYCIWLQEIMDSINLLRTRERIRKIYSVLSDISFHTVKGWHMDSTYLSFRSCCIYFN